MIDHCDCPMAGWCERHKMNKPKHFHMLCQTRDDYRAMWDRKVSQEPRQAPTPTIPSWVRIVGYFRSPEDYGVGDTVQRYAAMLGGELFKQWSKRIGLPCNCTARQAEWNQRWPYRGAENEDAVT